MHGDDFTTAGPKSGLDKFVEMLKEKYELKEAARLGPGPEDDKEARVLNRIIRWTDYGLEYEADPRQGEKLVEELGLQGANGVTTPATKASIAAVRADRPLPDSQTTHFRALAARSNYLAADRPESQFASKEVCRFMAAPTQLSAEAFKRFGRYYIKFPRLIYEFPFQDKMDALDVYVDTDHAGCLKTRKSTSGGCIMAGQHLLKSWSSTQPTITSSSGEGEFMEWLRVELAD